MAQRYRALTRLWERSRTRDDDGQVHIDWIEEGEILVYPDDFPPNYPPVKVEVLVEMERIAAVEEAPAAQGTEDDHGGSHSTEL